MDARRAARSLLGAASVVVLVLVVMVATQFVGGRGAVQPAGPVVPEECGTSTVSYICQQLVTPGAGDVSAEEASRRLHEHLQSSGEADFRAP